MSRRPSSLQLALLSDRELADKIAEALMAIKVRAAMHEDDTAEQKRYQSLENEQIRRKIMARLSER